MLPITTAPSFTPAAGTYKAAQKVSLADSTRGAVIYYTTNGATSTSRSKMYIGPIKVNSSQTIKAKAYAVGYAPSAAETTTYMIR